MSDLADKMGMNQSNLQKSLAGNPTVDRLQEVATALNVQLGELFPSSVMMPPAVADTPVTLACKAHLRNARPVLVAVSTNDGLAANAAAIGRLLARRHFYFVPFGQDDPEKKPTSLVADMNAIPEAADAALRGEQLQPVLLRG